jgi:hypothetical protein
MIMIWDQNKSDRSGLWLYVDAQLLCDKSTKGIQKNYQMVMLQIWLHACNGPYTEIIFTFTCFWFLILHGFVLIFAGFVYTKWKP